MLVVIDGHTHKFDFCDYINIVFIIRSINYV